MTRLWLTLMIAICIPIGGCTKQSYDLAGGSGSEPSDKSSTYDRVIRSGELRVGYLTEPPYLAKSTATGHMSGIFADVADDLAKRLGLKLVWVEEVSLTGMPEALRQHRFDMIMLPLWRNAARAKNVGFSIPIYYSTVGVYVRAGDTRFDQNRALLNNDSVTVAALDGELAGDIARSDFPLARVQSLSQLSDYSQLMMEVAARKADVTFFDRVEASRFMARNPGRIKDITGDQPVRVYAECLIMPIDDFRFRSMIDASLAEMIDNGDIDRAFVKNGEDPAKYYRPAIPYRNPTTGR